MKKHSAKHGISGLLKGCVMAIAFVISDWSLLADITLPAIFGDHMVLQQGIKLPVWGTADAGESVTVTVGKESAQTKAAADGSWRVDLAPLPEGPAAVTMTVAGKKSLTFTDVLVGDVWVCSGQSNMEFSLVSAHNSATEIPKANDSTLRLFMVAKKAALDPVTALSGTWQLCTPDSATKFSAVGYFFGRDLRAGLQRPVGLIGTYWGGTPAQAWTSLSGLKKEPTLKDYVDQADRIHANFVQAQADYPAKLEAFKADMAKWQQNEGKVYNKAMQEWKVDAQKALAANQPEPARPKTPATMPKPPLTPEGGSNAPATLFNGMISPLVPYALKGAIWYQGESNAGRAAEYRILFPIMITDWREKWGQGDFPFLFVQLASFQAGPVQNWPFLREAQLNTLALPNTGMASAVDIGSPYNIHPQDKIDVGTRLALAASHVAYGKKIVYSGPIYDSMKVEGDVVRIMFTHTGGGLMIGTAPWRPAGVEPLSDATLVGFTIAGKDKNWIPADAKIKDDSVIVSSPQVSDPIAVRYAWANAPLCNLYNKEGLPASPFRTDDWPEINPTPKK